MEPVLVVAWMVFSALRLEPTTLALPLSIMMLLPLLMLEDLAVTAVLSSFLNSDS